MSSKMPGRGVVVALCLSAACSSADPPSKPAGLTTRTDSATLPTRDARLAFLARYLKPKAPVFDAEFVIRYQDNSTGALPGPSDWDIRAVLVVDGNGAPWFAGWTPCAGEAAPALPAWARELLARRREWQQWSKGARCLQDPQHAASTIFAFDGDVLLAYRNVSDSM